MGFSQQRQRNKPKLRREKRRRTPLVPVSRLFSCHNRNSTGPFSFPPLWRRLQQMTQIKLVAGATPLPDAPYPADTSARGWYLALDVARLKKADTWVLCPPSLRCALLRVWVEAWDQTPVGSHPDDDEIIAARIDMDPPLFTASRRHLLRGFRPHADGRLYHPVLVSLAVDRIKWRERETERIKKWRETKALEARNTLQTRNQPISNDTVAVAVAVAGAVEVQKSKSFVAASGSRLPNPWELPDDWLAWAIGSAGMTEPEAVKQSLIFRDYWHAKPGTNGRKVDWFATWRNWCRKAKS
jgi:hypothetical protein